jgi:hypothetical protein
VRVSAWGISPTGMRSVRPGRYFPRASGGKPRSRVINSTTMVKSTRNLEFYRIRNLLSVLHDGEKRPSFSFPSHPEGSAHWIDRKGYFDLIWTVFAVHDVKPSGVFGSSIWHRINHTSPYGSFPIQLKLYCESTYSDRAVMSPALPLEEPGVAIWQGAVHLVFFTSRPGRRLS